MKNAKIGCTGTKDYVTNEQINTVFHIIQYYQPIESHQGDCINFDNIFNEIVKIVMGDNCIRYKHPPINNSLRAFSDTHYEFPALPYLDRNKNIVKSTDILIAGPKEYTEQLRSGTWSTIRYARKLLKPIIIVFPNGSYIGGYSKDLK